MTGARLVDCPECNGNGCHDCDHHGDLVLCGEALCGERMTRTEAAIEGYYCYACRNVLDEPDAGAAA